jgi:hypothetical protein
VPSAAIPKTTEVLVIQTANQGITMETLPLVKTQLMDHVYLPVGPLMPLRTLMCGGPAGR